MNQFIKILFILLCFNELFINSSYFLLKIIAMNELNSRYIVKGINLYSNNLKSEKQTTENTINSNKLQNMKKSSKLHTNHNNVLNRQQSNLILSTNLLHNASNNNNNMNENLKLNHQHHQVGGYGLVSSSQNHISLESLSHTTKSPLNIEKNLPIITNSLISSIEHRKWNKDVQKSEWPTSIASEEYSKINMRIMGQPIDPSVVNYLHPDVSPHKVKKLRKILSGSLDKEWTSETPPRILRQRGISGLLNSNDQEIYSSLDNKLLKELQQLNFTFRNSYGIHFTLTEEQIQPYRYWLIERATCEMDFIWEDLGPLFWPRWIRRGVCLNRPGHSCSWPSGMKCRPSGSRALQLLHWKCEDAIQLQSRENAADQRIRRRVSLNTFHSGFYEMEPVKDNSKIKHKRDTYAHLSLKDNSISQLHNSYRKLQTRNLENLHYTIKNSWNNIKSSDSLKSSSSSSLSSPNTKDEKRRRRARRLIKRLSITANGYHCYWQVQKYLISDRCSCSCS